jgi:hypothetical protein
MRIQIEPSEILVDIDGVTTRVWNGVTEEGVQCFVFVARVAVRAEDDALDLASVLIEVDQPEIAGLRNAI